MKKILLTITIIIIILFCIYILKGVSNEIEVSNYKIKNKKLKNNLRIVHISDLHATLYGLKQRDIIKLVEEKKPDLIVVTGDMMKEELTIDNTIDLLDGISMIAPTYYVAGNHEYRDEKVNELFDYLKKSNITHLVDSKRKINIKGNDIIIYGLDDFMGAEYWNRDYDNNGRLMKLSDNEHAIKILLSHHPEMVELYNKYDFDLIFSGHAHGGQLRIPGIVNGLVAPNQGLFPKYTKGVYELENEGKLVVSAGLAISKAPRIYNRPELVVVDFEKRSDSE